MEDFFIRATMAGIGIALVGGPLGCFLVWRRQAFFGAALSHSALLGVALGFLLGIDLTVGIFALCLFLAVSLVWLERLRLLASDTLLGIIAHSALALGLVALAFIEGIRVDLLAYLFGDVLAVSVEDLILIYLLVMVSVTVLVFIWRSFLSSTVNEDLAEVEGVPVTRVRLAFTLLIAGMIAVGMKIVGILLIISLLIVPAAAARRLSATPEQMAVIAAVIGVLSVIAGLFGSLRWDIPAGPAIVVAATFLFVVSISWPRRRVGTAGASNP